ncbi:MAG: hypothetical protein SFY80_00805 [Verrucomicrobiota bacterium]|nr:hypothetical protein [Verrucomicrobiota bacterium]
MPNTTNRNIQRLAATVKAELHEFAVQNRDPMTGIFTPGSPSSPQSMRMAYGASARARSATAGLSPASLTGKALTKRSVGTMPAAIGKLTLAAIAKRLASTAKKEI